LLPLLQAQQTGACCRLRRLPNHRAFHHFLGPSRPSLLSGSIAPRANTCERSLQSPGTRATHRIQASTATQSRRAREARARLGDAAFGYRRQMRGVRSRRRGGSQWYAMIERTLLRPTNRDGPMDLRERWEAQAAQWIAWARTEGHDSYWRFHRDQFLQIVPRPGRRTVDSAAARGG
jgi:hypothetical protein